MDRVHDRLQSFFALSGWRARGSLFALGAFAVLGFAPFFIWPAYILSFALFFAWICQRSQNAQIGLFKGGWWFGFGFFLASLYWIASAFIARGGIYVVLAPFGALLLPAGLALFFALAASMAGRLRRFNPLIFSLCTAALFWGAEWLRGHILSGLPWNLPGYIFKAGNPVSQSAYHIGIYGLCALTLLLAASTALWFIPAQQKAGRAGLPVMLALFGGLWGYGTQRLAKAEVSYHDDVTFLIVTPPISQSAKFEDAQYTAIVDAYLEGSVNRPEERITHILWPEGAIPYLGLLEGEGLTDPGVQNAVTELLRPGQTLFLGLNTISGPREDRQYYNSLIGLTQEADRISLSSRYDKFKLVPFGEYFPGNQLVAGLNIPALTAFTTSFAPGEPSTAKLYGLPVASQQICFEAIFPGFTQRQEKAGPPAEFILTISNDGWFGRSTGPQQHFNQLRYRAIENGLPIVRAASNGPSGVIDPYGRRTDPLFENAQSGRIISKLPRAIGKKSQID